MRYIDKEQIEFKVIRTLARKEKEVYYYFDGDGIYRSCINLRNDFRFLGTKGEFEIYSVGKEKVLYSVYGARNCISRSCNGIKFENQNMVISAIAHLKEGDTLETLDNYLSSMKLKKHDGSKNKGLNKFITGIAQPIFVRTPENSNELTFDFVHITVCIVKEWEEERLKYIEKHKQEIFKMVVERLKADKQFQKYGIPVNCLKAQATVTKQSTIQFIFALKKQ